MIDFIRRGQGTWRELIILPHTIRAYAEELGSFRQNCFVFCRERPSYDFVKRYAPNANTFLSHDLAFGSNLDEIRNQKPNLRARSMIDFIRQLRSQARYQMQIARTARARKQPDVLNAFRVDVEKTAIETPADNVDISSALAGNAMLPIPSLLATRRMIQMLSNFRVIRTNRLHVAIMAAMLGQEVHFYDNSYGKNYDVFVHSMEGRFNNVHWHAS
jgi:exopolysaccharide biosynthesis predicted pyruvyltransferase EpsI